MWAGTPISWMMLVTSVSMLLVSVFMAFMFSCLLSYSHYSKNRKPAQVPGVPMLISCLACLEICGGRQCVAVGHPQESALLLLWGRDFILAEDSGRPEYSMYCGHTELPSRGERSVQSAKVGFSAVLNYIRGSQQKRGQPKSCPLEYVKVIRR